MKYVNILDFAKTLNDISEKFNSFIQKNSDSPLFWGALFLGLLIICLIAFEALHGKGK